MRMNELQICVKNVSLNKISHKKNGCKKRKMSKEARESIDRNRKTSDFSQKPLTEETVPFVHAQRNSHVPF